MEPRAIEGAAGSRWAPVGSRVAVRSVRETGEGLGVMERHAQTAAIKSTVAVRAVECARACMDSGRDTCDTASERQFAEVTALAEWVSSNGDLRTAAASEWTDAVP